MSSRLDSLTPRLLLRWIVVAATLLAFTCAQAAEIKVEVMLVWGANEAKSPNAKHKPVDKELAKKLGDVFKWKYYFEVNRQTETIPSRATKRIKVSPKCEIDITELEGPKVEVTLYGEGKKLNRSVKQLNKGEYFILAGDDKNESAWFIIVTLLEEK
jgi:hypothetical protein